MTTWAWAPLPVGSYGLPAPALMMTPWVLTARAPRPKRCGFRRIRGSSDWSKVSPAAGLAVDFRSINAGLVVHADDPGAVDYDGLLNMLPGSYEGGGLRWIIPVFTRDDPQTAQVFEQAHDRGELWLITGNVPAYWALDQREMPFEQLFPKADTWATRVPLARHLFVDGVGTRPR